MSDEAAIADRPRPSLARRIIAFPLTLMLIALLAVLLGGMLANFLSSHMPAPPPNSPWLVARVAFGIACRVAFFWAFIRWVDPPAANLFGRRHWARELLAGLAAGALIFAAIVGVAAILGLYQVTGRSGLDTIWTPLAVPTLGAGFAEELVFRGILFRYIEKMAGSWVALALTAGLFGAVHILNPGASWFSSLAIAVEAGLLLGAVYMLTRRLWAAMGLHAAWNFTQGWVFGLPVSGTLGGVGLLNGRLSGPELLTGGAFGLEASLIALVIATAAGLATLVLAIRKGELVRPMWVQRKE